MSVFTRKEDHLRICREQDVQFQAKSAGFERYDFNHCALPELDYGGISLEKEFLGKKLGFPFLISAMTGGCREAEKINAALGELAARFGVALALGSQRPLLEDESQLFSYLVAREQAPDAVIIGNIGVGQIRGGNIADKLAQLVKSIRADALAVHLNPLQEILQPEGEKDFTGVLRGIETLTASLPVPVIVKEVGCGISAAVAEKLFEAGVSYIDVAGAGGTSWALIESFRGADEDIAGSFREWGIPTVDCLEEVLALPGARVIASGGLRSGRDVAVSLALGAELGGAALPLFKALDRGGVEEAARLLSTWREELRAILFLTGCGSVDEFRDRRPLRRIHDTGRRLTNDD